MRWQDAWKLTFWQKLDASGGLGNSKFNCRTAWCETLNQEIYSWDVRVYVLMCWSHLGMSIWGHVRVGHWMHALHNDVETTFLGNGGWGGMCGWPFAMYVFCGAKCINECWMLPMAGDSDKTSNAWHLCCVRPIHAYVHGTWRGARHHMQHIDLFYKGDVVLWLFMHSPSYHGLKVHVCMWKFVFAIKWQSWSVYLHIQVTYPLCTIASNPRLPEHCIEYARILLWPKEKPFEGQWSVP